MTGGEIIFLSYETVFHEKLEEAYINFRMKTINRFELRENIIPTSSK